MRTVTVQRTVSMGHRLPSYKGICSSPHGHNFRVEATVREPLDIFIDFKLLDGTLTEMLADFDHAMVLQTGDHVLTFLRDNGFRTIEFNIEPTTEVIAVYFFTYLQQKGYAVHQVRVSETDKYTATADESNYEIKRVA